MKKKELKCKEELIERIEKAEKANGEIGCYILITDKCLCTHGKGNELLSLIACLTDELSNNIPDYAIRNAVEAGLNGIEETTDDEKIEKLSNILEELKDVVGELDNE